MAELWDPLETTNQASEIVVAAQKRAMQNILKSYVGLFDPFAELLQNAMDAVDARARELKEDGYQKTIWILIDLKNNAIAIADNGIGFKEDQFKTFLCPNISFKDGEFTRGKKGVGATYLAYGFNHLELGTKTASYSIVAEINDGRKWLDDMKGIISRPKVMNAVQPSISLDKVDRGSLFALRLGGLNTRPKDLKWISATTAEQWKTILLLKTPLGHIELTGTAEKTPTLFDLTVIDSAGNSTSLHKQRATYIYPHNVIASSIQLKEIVEEQRKRLEKGQDPSKLPDRFKQLNGIYEYFSPEASKKLLEGSENVSLIDQYKVEAYGYFCYSVKVWDQFNDEIAKLRKGWRILRGGLQLATDHMLQGDLVTIPLTSNIGYQNQAHVIVHFTNADPDLGRKGFQPELRATAEEIAVAIVNLLKKRRSLLKKDTGAAPTIVDEGKLDDWIQQQKEHEKEHPLTIKNPNFFLPLREISITARPLSEQDVIVLFNQLIAGGVIRGLKVMATSSHQQYDGVYKYFVNKPLDNHIFNAKTNPLGVQQQTHADDYTSKPYVLEYKHNVDALIQEFENGEKSEKDISLVVAWEIGSEWTKRYQVTSLLDLANIQHRPFHGITHICRDENSGDIRFYGIILSELIEYLEDIEAAQAGQKAKYAEA